MCNQNLNCFLVTCYHLPLLIFLQSVLSVLQTIWEKRSLCFYFNFFFFLPLRHLWHMEVPRLGVHSELQLPAYAIATVTPDPSCFCDPHHSSPQRWILNLLSEARDRTCSLIVPSWIRFHYATMGTPPEAYIFNKSRRKVWFKD